MAGVATIADRIQSDLAAFLKQPKDKIELRHSLQKDLGLNSVDTIELIFLIEGTFNFEFSDAEVQQHGVGCDCLRGTSHDLPRLVARAVPTKTEALIPMPPCFAVH